VTSDSGGPDTQSAVFGIYSSRAALEGAVEALKADGFHCGDISVVSAPIPGLTDMSDAAAATTASAGPGPAASVGSALGWLVGMSALAMAGGVFIVAGPVMAALARMGQAAGDVVGALAGFGVPEVEARRYEGRIASGGMLLSVHTDDAEWFRRGQHILEQTGAEELMAVAAAPRAPVVKTAPPGVVAAANREAERVAIHEMGSS